MDEFKPEDELKPDTSDRRPPRSRKTSSAPGVSVSRQHMMMGIGILVLLLLVLSIGSALNTTGNSSSSQQPSSLSGTFGSGDKNIDLSDSSSISGQSDNRQPIPDAMTATPVPASSLAAAPAGHSPQELSAPPVSSTPTQAALVQVPANQQRIELSGDLNRALANQQGLGGQDSGSSLPTASATVAAGVHSAVAKPIAGQPHQAAQRPVTQQRSKPDTSHKPAASQPVRESKPKNTNTTSYTASAPAKAASTSVSDGSYTLQLSSASRSDTLNAWAKKQNLSSYHVYKTTRNDQPWFVLVSGSYATPADAKLAVSSLPAEVRAQNPWVKSVSQVKKEASD